MTDFGGELDTSPSETSNRDFLRNVELKNLQRNSSLTKFFRNPMIVPDYDGMINEEEMEYITSEEGDVLV